MSALEQDPGEETARAGLGEAERPSISPGVKAQDAWSDVTRGRTTLVEVERVLGQQLDGETKEDESRPPRILLVDDDEDARLLMRHLLERDDYVEKSVDADRFMARVHAVFRRAL
jgi:PleD family two-component response regulator